MKHKKVLSTGAGGKGFYSWFLLFNYLGYDFWGSDCREISVKFNFTKSPKGNSLDFIGFINKFLEDDEFEYIILCVDEEIWNICENIEKVYSDNINKFLNPIGKEMNLIYDKKLLSEIALDYKIKTPKILYEIPGDFPFVIKKRLSRGSKDFYLVRDKNDFQLLNQEIFNNSKEYFFQEYIEGIHVQYDIIVTINGIISWKITSIVRDGNLTTEFYLSTTDDEIVYKIVNFIKNFSLNSNFIVNVDFIEKEGELYLLEINPRPSLQFPSIIYYDDYLMNAFSKILLENKLMECGYYETVKRVQYIFV